MRLLAVAALALASSGSWEDEVAAKAQAFLKSLSPTLLKAASFPYDAETRFEWNFLPGAKPGVAIKELTEVQRKAADDLLRTTLSQLGYSRVQAIRALEEVLFERENKNPTRDAGAYYLAFFGQPGDKGVWAWRFEGHHTSLTFGFRDGKLVSSTPQFFGVNPEPAPLSKESSIALDLARSLTAGQRKQGLLNRDVPADIITGMQRKAEIKNREGVPYRDLDCGQRRLLESLIKSHASVQHEKEQERRWKAIQAENMDDVVFAWIGPLEKQSRHYYRIQGRNLLIEFDSTQADGNHIHTVWRNLREDFGGDPLTEHYHHGHAH